jgi:flagellar basal body-associated protein FliL
MKKIILILVIILAFAASAYYYTFVYSKTHHRDAQGETSIIISADSLVAAYQANEQKANTTYLNKAVEVTGTILTIDKDQANHITILMGKADAFSNVSITLSSSQPIMQKVGDVITVKGVCTGNLSDVILNEAVIK